MNKVLLSVHHKDGAWAFAAAAGPWPRHDESPMFATVSGATRAALDWAATNKVEIEMTGHPDRTMLAAAGVRFRDSRGGRRRGAGARARQRAKFDSVMAVRRAAKTAP